jgi:hypothetical protein
MKFFNQMVRIIKGPFWFLKNILVACWVFDLSGFVYRRGQTPARRLFYRFVLSAAALIEVLFMTTVVVILSVALLALPIHWAGVKTREIWFRNYYFIRETNG